MDHYKQAVFMFLCGLLAAFVADKQAGWPGSCTPGEFMLVQLVQELMHLITDSPNFTPTPLRDHAAWPHRAPDRPAAVPLAIKDAEENEEDAITHTDRP